MVMPAPSLDLEAAIEDASDGVLRWQWACKDAVAKYRGEAMAQADRQAREFRNLTPGIEASDLVRGRLVSEARRASLWWRMRSNGLMFGTAVAAVFAAAMLLMRILGWW